MTFLSVFKTCVAAVVVAVGCHLATSARAMTYQKLSSAIAASKIMASSSALGIPGATKVERWCTQEATKSIDPRQSWSLYVSAFTPHTVQRYFESSHGSVSQHQREAMTLIIAILAVIALVFTWLHLRLHSVLKHMRASESAKESKILMLKAAETAKDGEIAKLDGEVNALRETIQDRVGDVDDHWQQKISDFHEQVHRLEHSLEARNVELEDSRLRMGNMLTEIGEKEDAVKTLEDDVRLLRGQNAQAEAQVAGIQSQMKTIEQIKQDELRDLQAQYNKLEDERDSLQGDMARLSMEIQTLKALPGTPPLKVDLSEEPDWSHTTLNTMANDITNNQFDMAGEGDGTHHAHQIANSFTLENQRHLDFEGIVPQPSLRRALTTTSEEPLSVTPLRVSAPAFIPSHESFAIEPQPRQTSHPQADSASQTSGALAEFSSTQGLVHRQARLPHIAAINEKLAESKIRLQEYERNVKFMGRPSPGEEGTTLSDAYVGKQIL